MPRPPLALGISLALAASPGPPAAAEATKDRLRTSLETTLTKDGRVLWSGVGVGTFVEHRISQPGVATSEMRQTLVATEDGRGRAIRTQVRQAGAEWGEAVDRPLGIVDVPGAERRVEPLGSEAVEVASGRSVACTKERWTRWVDGKPAKPEYVVWWDAGGVPVKWVADLGDGWTSTFLVVRDGVEHRVGEKTVRCREVRQTSVASMRGLGPMESVELWSDAVPERVVRQETRGPGIGPAQGPRVREVTAFEVK